MNRLASTSLRVAVVLALALPALACHKTRRYESVVQIVRREAVEKDESGATLQIDLELEWDACPGDQFQVIRGGKGFAECTARYDVGDLVPVHVMHWWDERGYYRWDIERLGDCPHAIEPDSLGSYEKGQECRDLENHGHKSGFVCSRKPFRQLVKRCPWMARE